MNTTTTIPSRIPRYGRSRIHSPNCSSWRKEDSLLCTLRTVVSQRRSYYRRVATKLPSKILKRKIDQERLSELLQQKRQNRVAPNYWSDISNQREFFDSLGQTKFKLIRYEDWYSYQAQHVNSNGGSGLIASEYKGSLINALEQVYPEYEWHIWQFIHTSPGYWTEELHHRKFFDWAARQFQLQQPEEWYQVTSTQIMEVGGSSLLHSRYESSLIKALSTVYPEYEWLPWYFVKVSKGYWENPDHRRLYFNWLAFQLDIRKPQDWFLVNLKEVQNFGGIGLLNQYYEGSLLKALEHVYVDYAHIFQRRPSQQIDSETPSTTTTNGFEETRSKSQLRLQKWLQHLFPDEQIAINYHHPNLRYMDTEQSMELDVFLPGLNLAFEYQGKQHYEDTNHMWGAVDKYQSRDEEKRAACEKIGIRLIAIPYWWNSSLASLKQILFKHYPELQNCVGLLQ